MQRIISIDVLRGFSLTGMVICHFMLEYGDAHAPESLLYFIMDHALGDFGAAWFLLLVGVSQVVFRRPEKGNNSTFGIQLLEQKYSSKTLF